MIQWFAYVVLPTGEIYIDPLVFLQLDYRGKFLCFQSATKFSGHNLSFLTDDESSQ